MQISQSASQSRDAMQISHVATKGGEARGAQGEATRFDGDAHARDLESSREAHVTKSSLSSPLLCGRTGAPLHGKQAALTEYELIDYVGKELSFMALYPITGRKHQLRIHLKNIHCPILGDGKYGGRDAFKNNLHNKMHLHAYGMEIENYLRKKLRLTADIPEKFKETMSTLGFSEALL